MLERLIPAEAACAQRLAELFEKNTTCLTASNETMGALGLTPENREAILGVMEHLGVISDVVHARGGSAGRFFSFLITPKALDVARAIRELEEAKKSERRDIVSEIQQKAKSHPVMAWLIFVAIVLAAVVATANQLWDLIVKIVKL
jgi:hypothetical protein